MYVYTRDITWIYMYVYVCICMWDIWHILIHACNIYMLSIHYSPLKTGSDVIHSHTDDPCAILQALRNKCHMISLKCKSNTSWTNVNGTNANGETERLVMGTKFQLDRRDRAELCSTGKWLQLTTCCIPMDFQIGKGKIQTSASQIKIRKWMNKLTSLHVTSKCHISNCHVLSK